MFYRVKPIESQSVWWSCLLLYGVSAVRWTEYRLPPQRYKSLIHSKRETWSKTCNVFSRSPLRHIFGDIFLRIKTYPWRKKKKRTKRIIKKRRKPDHKGGGRAYTREDAAKAAWRSVGLIFKELIFRMSFGLQRVVLGTWSRDGHVLPPSWERAVLRLTITGPSYEERLTRSGSHCREPLTSYIVLCPFVLCHLVLYLASSTRCLPRSKAFCRSVGKCSSR